jgi:protein tyrosine phosphatase (PTP) superfamily phosphohydrolase (DUF442 family)
MGHMPGRATIAGAAVWGIALGVLGAGGIEFCSTFFGRNWHVVIPGQAYRSAQLTRNQYRDAIHANSIRTVVNLRGTGPDQDWYLDESRATFDAGIAQEDVTLSAYRLPAPDELRRLINIFDHAEYPILFHCRQGVDRTGLAAALLLMLRTDVTPAQARKQLGLRYGHIPFGPTWVMFQCLNLYDAWLRQSGRVHSPDALRQWADHGYCPANLRGRLMVVDPLPELRVGIPAAIRVRAVNDSPEPWELQPGTETGIHVRYMVCGHGAMPTQLGRAGQFRATVPAGGSIDLTLAIAPPRQPGPCLLLADLADGNRYSFCQFSNDPLELMLFVGEAAP